MNELLFLAKKLYNEYSGKGYLIKEARHHAYDNHWDLLIVQHEASAKIRNELSFITDELVNFEGDGFVVDYAERVTHKGQPFWKLKVHNIEIDRQKEAEEIREKQESEPEYEDGCGVCEERAMLAAQEILDDDAEVKEEDDGVCSERQD